MAVRLVIGRVMNRILILALSFLIVSCSNIKLNANLDSVAKFAIENTASLVSKTCSFICCNTKDECSPNCAAQITTFILVTIIFYKIFSEIFKDEFQFNRAA